MSLAKVLDVFGEIAKEEDVRLGYFTRNFDLFM